MKSGCLLVLFIVASASTACRTGQTPATEQQPVELLIHLKSLEEQGHLTRSAKVAEDLIRVHPLQQVGVVVTIKPTARKAPRLSLLSFDYQHGMTAWILFEEARSTQSVPQPDESSLIAREWQPWRAKPWLSTWLIVRATKHGEVDRRYVQVGSPELVLSRISIKPGDVLVIPPVSPRCYEWHRSVTTMKRLDSYTEFLEVCHDPCTGAIWSRTRANPIVPWGSWQQEADASLINRPD